jgi:predicted nucleotidyltransferase component of viral defense system
MVQPELVEKDFYLTRLLWALGDPLGDGLLLTGGTLLSKVDFGFFRMSEDADLVMPHAPSKNRGTNAKRINQVRDALKAVEVVLGVKRLYPSGEEWEKGSHRRWILEYSSDFGPQSIQLEVALRRVFLPARQVRLKQLLEDPLIGDYANASCWALDATEARAEKVRAAFTRDAIRDFFDLERLYEAGTDLKSKAFIELVNSKLAELAALPFEEQDKPFGMNSNRRRSLEKSLKAELPAVLRMNAPRFDLDSMLKRFAELWNAHDAKGHRSNTEH